MKAIFSKSTGRLGAKTLPLLAGLMLSPLLAAGTDPSYSNSSTNYYYSDLGPNTVPYLPNIDATVFYNSGHWDVYTEFPLEDYALGVTYPYITDHTLYYTNTSTMTGSVGWEFDYGPLPLGGGAWRPAFSMTATGRLRPWTARLLIQSTLSIRRY